MQSVKLDVELIKRIRRSIVWLRCASSCSAMGVSEETSSSGFWGLTRRNSAATILVAPAVMHRMKLFEERLATGYTKADKCNLRLVDGLYDDAEDRLPFLFAEMFEEATRCSRKRLLELIVRYAGHKRSKVSKSLVCEDGATDRKADGDTKELGQEHKGDAVCHVCHLDDTQNHSETGL